MAEITIPDQADFTMLVGPDLATAWRSMKGDPVARAFRFGVALNHELTGDPVAQAVHAERLGYDVVVVGDHVGAELSPMLTLAAAAQRTERIRLATLVINADLRSPTQLAWEAVTPDHLSNGRFELGVGAGHTPQEYGAVGLPQRPSRVRKQRLMELVEIVRRLVDGDTVQLAGEFFDLRSAHVGRSAQEHLPILVGGNGDRLLQHAGRHADIVGLQGLGRTLADGHRHEVLWSVEHLDRQIEQIRLGAAIGWTRSSSVRWFKSSRSPTTAVQHWIESVAGSTALIELRLRTCPTCSSEASTTS